MKVRSAARLASSLWLAYAFSTVAFLILGFRNGEGDLLANLPILLAFCAFATIGALLISRYLRHPIGWIFMTIGLGTALGNLAQQYAIYSLFTSPTSLLPAGVGAAWLGAWLWVASAGVIIFVPLLVPSGRPSTSRWRPVVWAAAAALVAIVVTFMFKPGLVDIGTQYPVANPLGIAGSRPAMDVIQSLAGITYLLLLVVAIGGLLLKVRRSRGEERQQLKWFAYAAAFMAVILFSLQPLVERFLPQNLSYAVGSFLFGLGVAALPIGTGIAILKYRLYDIDFIINRTLVYGALTAILGAAYIVVVTVAGTVLEGSALVTAGATLTVAALFQPLRQRIQSFIDRRFYRRKYDAVRTAEALSAQLRDEVNLEAMRADLVAAVQETMQPRRVSLWLKG
jgi:hypothetical protein